LTATTLALRGITKAFPGVIANDAIDLDVRSGEIHALLGENGAGKSTLMKILYGFYHADAGSIQFDGEPVQIRSPEDARRLGVGMLFQTFTLVPAFTVAENVALFRPELPVVIDRASLERDVRRLAGRYGFEIDPRAVVGRLSAGEQQKVEIVKLLLGGSRILIFDEPTSVLAPHEIEALFEVFRRLRADGYAVIFITHKLREVLACADRITVLRRGRVAGTRAGAGATVGDLIALMFGATPPQVRSTRSAVPREGRPALELEAVATRPAGERIALDAVDLKVWPSEILAVAGVAGNGQEELGDVVLGATPVTAGRKVIFGEDATRWSVGACRSRGLAFVPENAIWMAVVPGMDLVENMILGDTRGFAGPRGITIDRQRAGRELAEALAPFGIAPHPHAAAGTLSGGNLQRLVFAREISRDPRLIVALHPTRGLDVPSAAAVHEQLLRARARGAAVLLISHDLDEVLALADRVVVLYRGRVAGAFAREDADAHEIGRLMTGSAA
jgi:simple sugar transport system ATP-binding protein